MNIFGALCKFLGPARTPVGSLCVFLLLPGVLAAQTLTSKGGDADDSWAQFRGPSADGSVEGSFPGPAVALRENWKIEVGSGYCGLSVASGKVVTCAALGESDVLLALDASDGSKLWSVDLSEAFEGYGGSLDGAIATPTIAGDGVYMLGRRGQMVAVELESGRELWRQDLAQQGAEAGYYGFSSSPLVLGDRVFVQVGGELGGVVALERNDGSVAWRGFASGIDAQSPVAATIGGREQLLIATNEWLAGLEPKTGGVLWSWPYEGRSAFVTATSPLPLEDGRIFFPAADDRAVLLAPPATGEASGQAGTVPADAPEPAVVWQENVLNRTYSPSAVAGGALVGFTSRLLSAYSVETGERLWRSRAPGDGFLIVVGEQLLVITKDGSLHLADLEDSEGQPGYFERAALPLFEEIVWTPPSFADGSAFVRSMTEIARVDLIAENDRMNEHGPTAAPTDASAHGAGQGTVPSVLLSLLDAEPGQVEPRIDRFLADIDTPIVTTGDDGAKALFLYRDGDERASDVGIAGDFLGMRMEGAFVRLADSSLWWYEVDVDPRLQYTYLLYVDYEPQLDPHNPRREPNSVMGWNANWVRGPDPVEMSYFAMPDWPGPPPHLASGALAPVSRGRVVLASQEGIAEEHAQMLSDVRVWLPTGLRRGCRSAVSNGLSARLAGCSRRRAL